ncbi:MAG: hypothetical protein HY332_12230 [Chloroflexi bacterium]|nr:hypothetical protein [Chloroflexota bacterium]
MKITRVTPVMVRKRTVLVRVETDEGITGWGEPSKVGGRLLVPVIKESLAPLPLGRIRCAWRRSGNGSRSGPIWWKVGRRRAQRFQKPHSRCHRSPSPLVGEGARG